MAAAKRLFTRSGIDRVTMAQIATAAGVAVPTVYALFKSKAGILQAMMQATLFGPGYQTAQAQLVGVSDAVELIAATAKVARAIYESESAELALMRGASAFSLDLRKTEQEFEALRFKLQEARVKKLFEERKAKKGLSIAEARHILWMYTSRDIYRMLVQERGWTPDEYQHWLADTLVSALVKPASPK